MYTATTHASLEENWVYVPKREGKKEEGGDIKR